MKKISILFLVAITSVLLFACTVAKISEIKVNLDSIKTTYKVGETVDLSGIKVDVYYEDNTKKTVGFSAISIAEIDNTQVGDVEVEVTYSQVKTTFTIQFIDNDDQQVVITGFSLPRSIDNYLSVIKKSSTDRDGFFINETHEDFEYYVVGNQNAYHFLPLIDGIDENEENVVITQFRSDNEIALYDESTQTFHVIDQEELDLYVTIDNEHSLYHFSDHALDKVFKLTVQPEGNTDHDFIVEHTFKVVKGYNVHSVTELNLFDNVNDSAWESYRLSKGIEKPLELLDGMILHRDLKINPSDIPSSYVWQQEDYEQGNIELESLVGSLKNRYAIYALVTPNDHEFTFHGNYFTIDASDIPLVKKGDGGVIITEGTSVQTHSSLFNFGGDELNSDGDINNSLDKNYIGTAKVKNLNMVGNSPKNAEGHEGIGGITIYMVGAKYFEIYNSNTISSNVFATLIGHWTEDSDTILNEYKIISSKAYDAYNSFIFVYGASLTILNSELKDSGGPAVIMTHHYLTDGFQNVEKQYPKLVTENTTIESWVAGTEAWFNVMGVPAVTITQVKSLLEGIEQIAAATNNQATTTKILPDGTVLFNAIAVIISSLDLERANEFRGHVDLNRNENNTSAFDLLNYYQTLYQLGAQTMVLQSSGGGYAYVAAENPPVKPIGDPTYQTLLSGDYLMLYAGALAVVVGYVN